jgi:hypothetical protein
MKRLCILVVATLSALRLCGQSQPGFGVLFVVPADSTNQYGNTFSPSPFYAPSFRYQQVYAASEFAYLTNFGGGWLATIQFRGEENRPSFRVQIPNLQIDFSTTQRSPDGLSPVFAENVGPDNRVVFAGYLDAGATGGPSADFIFQIRLSSLFLYNPSAGNLLMDIRIFQGKTNQSFEPDLDAWNRTNDSVSRVLSGSVNASTGLVETIGLATRLFFWPNPKLTIERQSSSVFLWWPANPYFFVLQRTAAVGTQFSWENITNGIVRTNAVKTLTIPLNSIEAPAFFRLNSAPP